MVKKHHKCILGGAGENFDGAGREGWRLEEKVGEVAVSYLEYPSQQVAVRMSEWCVLCAWEC